MGMAQAPTWSPSKASAKHEQRALLKPGHGDNAFAMEVPGWPFRAVGHVLGSFQRSRRQATHRSCTWISTSASAAASNRKCVTAHTPRRASCAACQDIGMWGRRVGAKPFLPRAGSPRKGALKWIGHACCWLGRRLTFPKSLAFVDELPSVAHSPSAFSRVAKTCCPTLAHSARRDSRGESCASPGRDSLGDSVAHKRRGALARHCPNAAPPGAPRPWQRLRIRAPPPRPGAPRPARHAYLSSRQRHQK